MFWTRFSIGIFILRNIFVFFLVFNRVMFCGVDIIIVFDKIILGLKMILCDVCIYWSEIGFFINIKKSMKVILVIFLG